MQFLKNYFSSTPQFIVDEHNNKLILTSRYPKVLNILRILSLIILLIIGVNLISHILIGQLFSKRVVKLYLMYTAFFIYEFSLEYSKDKFENDVNRYVENWRNEPTK